MSFAELIYRLISSLKPLVPYLLPATAVTLLAALVLAVMTNKLWVGDRSWKWLGLFFCLDGRQAVAFSCAWLKLLLMAVFLIAFRELEVLHYFTFAVPGIVMCIASGSVSAALSCFFWTFLEVWAIFAANLVCTYYLSISSNVWLMVVYIFMSIFVMLLGVYRFLMETEAVSAARKIRPEEVWGYENQED